MTLKKRKDTGELAVAEPMDLSQDRLGDDADVVDDNNGEVRRVQHVRKWFREVENVRKEVNDD
jgi:hypothetical protein